MISSLVVTGLLALGQQPVRLKQPYEILPAPTDASAYSTRLGSAESAVYADGDVLTILYRSDTSDVQVMGGIAQPMKRIVGTDLNILQAKMSGGWDEALMSVGFYTLDKPFIDPKKMMNFRGSKAPAIPEKLATLQGQLIKKMVPSKSLGEERGITVYLPPNAPKTGLPAFYMADGQGAEGFAKVLEPLIVAGKVKPIAIVGVHSGVYKGEKGKPYDPKLDDRGRDYVYNTDPEWFEKHMAFFTKEVPAVVEKEFGISSARKDRAVFGFSNGGAFTAALSIKVPEFAANTIPLSVGVPPSEFAKPSSPMPRIFVAAGTLEPGFLFGSTTFYEQVKAWGADATLHTYVGGHDPLQWERVVAETAPQIFPPR